jgi:hypothetical protein
MKKVEISINRMLFKKGSQINKVVELGGVGNGKKMRTNNYFKLAVKTAPVHRIFKNSHPLLDNGH